MTEEVSESTFASSSIVVDTSESSFPTESHAKNEESKTHKLKRASKAASKKVKQGCHSYWSSACSVAGVKRKLPIISWLPQYNLNCLKSDVIAGLTVGLTVIPQGMAYAALAGLDLQVNNVFVLINYHLLITLRRLFLIFA